MTADRLHSDKNRQAEESIRSRATCFIVLFLAVILLFFLLAVRLYPEVVLFVKNVKFNL